MPDSNKKALTWDAVGERYYQTGTKKGVVYPYDASNTYGDGIAWNGLTAVTASPSGAEASAFYADDIKYLNLRSAEEFGMTIEAYSSPEEFDECDGTKSIAPGVKVGQQSRKMFGFCYRTAIGNDVDGADHAYMLHLVYGCTASPSEKSYATINDSPEPITLSWEVSTTPVEVPGCKPTATLDIDSRTVNAAKLAKLEEILYGKNPSSTSANDGVAPRLPLPKEVAELFGTDSDEEVGA